MALSTEWVALKTGQSGSGGVEYSLECLFWSFDILPACTCTYHFPHRKNNKSNTGSIACNAPCIFRIICMISPLLNVSGDSVRSSHISTSFAFKTFTINECV